MLSLPDGTTIVLGLAAAVLVAFATCWLCDIIEELLDA